MPHSSGGGSHSGGSSSGGGSSGGSHGSSGGSSSRTSSSYFSGARTFVVYNRKGYKTIYSDTDITAPTVTKASVIGFAICILPFIIVGICMLSGAINIPKALKADYAQTIVVEDSIGVITEKADLYAALSDFRAKTGIVPAVMTVNNEDWINHYNSLENYAYDLYVNRFDDENHWLIVYSQPENPDEDFNDWYWEGMQGDNTDDILNDDVLTVFNTNLQKYFTQSSKYTVPQAITAAFNDIYGSLMQTTVNNEVLLPAVIWLAFIGIFILVFIKSAVDSVKASKHGVEIMSPHGVQPTLYEDTCEYCGGRYIVGSISTCPHCGAALAPNSPHPVGKKKNDIE